MVLLKDKPPSLTSTEFKLLVCPTDNMSRALGFRELARDVPGYDRPERQARGAIKTHLWRLRKKLKARVGDAFCIVNIRGKGYTFIP